MSTVTCGKCGYFKQHNEKSKFGDNGFCRQWDEYKGYLTQQARIKFYTETLGGVPFDADLERDCRSHLPTEVLA